MGLIPMDLLKRLHLGGVRADEGNRAVLESLVEQGHCLARISKDSYRQPVYHLTEKGKLEAGSLAVRPLAGASLTSRRGLSD